MNERPNPASQLDQKWQQIDEAMSAGQPADMAQIMAEIAALTAEIGRSFVQTNPYQALLGELDLTFIGESHTPQLNAPHDTTLMPEPENSPRPSQAPQNANLPPIPSYVPLHEVSPELPVAQERTGGVDLSILDLTSFMAHVRLADDGLAFAFRNTTEIGRALLPDNYEATRAPLEIAEMDAQMPLFLAASRSKIVAKVRRGIELKPKDRPAGIRLAVAVMRDHALFEGISDYQLPDRLAAVMGRTFDQNELEMLLWQANRQNASD